MTDNNITLTDGGGNITISMNDGINVSVGTNIAASDLISLTDTPSTYSGEQLKYLRVNSGEDAVEFTNELKTDTFTSTATSGFAYLMGDDADTGIGWIDSIKVMNFAIDNNVRFRIDNSSNNIQLLTNTVEVLGTLKVDDIEEYTGSAGVTFGSEVTLADGSKLATSAAPIDDADIANKKYVDDNAGGGDVTGGSNLTTQYRMAYVEGAGELTESSSIVTDASGTLLVGSGAILQGSEVLSAAGSIYASSNLILGGDTINLGTSQKTKIGYQAGNTAGANTIFIGYQAGVGGSNTGAYNHVVGNFALEANTSGNKNVGMGYKVFQANTEGYQNTAMGYKALNGNQTGNYNAAFGDSSLLVATGSYNTAFGQGTLTALTTTDENAAFGSLALNKATTGQNLTAMGHKALYYNTIGSYNVSVGSRGGYFNVEGSYNTFIGYQAGYGAFGQSWSCNTAIGFQAGLLLENGGDNNTLIGYQAGDIITSGASCVIIGNDADPSAATTDNEIVVGHNAVGQGENKAVWGNTSITDHYFTGGINLQDAATITASTSLNLASGKVGVGLTPTANMDGLSIEAGLLTLKETTTPTADANYGKIYTKSDNKLYFQDGAGSENEVSFGGGGSSITQFDATVGASGADYTTLGAAITASKVRILVIDDTTETGDITLPSNVYIKGYGAKEVTINMGTYGFLDNSGANTDFFIEDLGIAYAYSSSGDLFELNMDGLTLNNVYIDNNSTASSCYAVRISTGSIQGLFNNIEIDVPNYAYGGLSFAGGCQASNIFVNCAGTSSTYALVTSCPLSNVVVGGTPPTSTACIQVGGQTTNIFFQTNGYIDISGSSVCSNVSGALVTVRTGNNSFLTNVKATGAGSSFIVNGDEANISNVYVNGTCTIDSGKDRNQISNCQFTGAMSITGNDNTINGCRVGADAGGGSNTITVNAAANNTIITGTRTDAAISDSGTGTTTAGNVVY